MRMLMTVQFDTEKANKAIKDRTMGSILGAALERLKPEATFFGVKDGLRTGFVVFDLQQLSDIPNVVEPFFQELDARIDLMPAMSFDDVQAGLQAYGSA